MKSRKSTAKGRIIMMNKKLFKCSARMEMHAAKLLRQAAPHLTAAEAEAYAAAFNLQKSDWNWNE
jgi:hypothetical protein